MSSELPRVRATTILAVRRDGRVALGGDGQVTVGDTIMKSNAQKVRLLRGGKLLAGFAGSVADALTLFEKFEEKLERYPGNLPRAAVELAKDWRSDRVLRRLEALLAVADRDHGFVISGNGELIEPDDFLPRSPFPADAQRMGFDRYTGGDAAFLALASALDSRKPAHRAIALTMLLLVVGSVVLTLWGQLH